MAQNPEMSSEILVAIVNNKYKSKGPNLQPSWKKWIITLHNKRPMKSSQEFT